MDIQRSAEDELAWMAGFFDGEGSIGIQSSRHRDKGNVFYKLYVSVGNTEKVLLEPFRERFGGSIRVDKRKSVRTDKHDRVKDYYIWRCDARKAKYVIKQILLYLKHQKKIEQAILGLKFQNQKRKGNGRKPLSMSYHHRQREFYEEMKELHH